MASESTEDTKILYNHLKEKEKVSPMTDYENIKEHIIDTLLGEGSDD